MSADLLVLNLGCGSVHVEGAVNIDIRPVGDVQADVRDLPYEDEVASTVIAHDVLEHFPDWDTEVLLAEWKRVLKPGGTLELRVPNLQALCAQIAFYADKPGGQLDCLIRNVYGAHIFGPDGVFDTHHTGWTPASLACVLSDAGFDVASNDNRLNMTVKAVKRA